MSKINARFDSDFEKRHAAPAKRAMPASCLNGGFYKSPSANAQVDLGKAVTVSWEVSCMNPAPQAVNIHLNAPQLKKEITTIFTWKGVEYKSGTFQAEIDPVLFNKNASTQLYFIVEDLGNDPNTPSFLIDNNQVGSSHTFTGLYDPKSPTNININTNNNTVMVVNNYYKPSGMTKGQIAAAVLVPILVVAACIAGYVFWSRKKEAIKRKEYRENLDQRMSIAPGSNWAPISAVGASAAIRHSMAMSNMDRNTRASSFFGRPDSEFYEGEEMRETRRVPSTYDSNGQTRQSRISFAESTTRPLNINRPAVPPLPAAYQKSKTEITSPDQTNLSPTQREGAFVLDDDSIRDRLSGGEAGNGRASVMDLGADSLPALAMMRTNDQANNEGAFVATPDTVVPTLPAPVLTREETSGDYKTYSIGAYSGNTDSYIGDNTSQTSYFGVPMPQVTDPDEALRIYATRSPTTPASVTASPFSGFAAGPSLAAAAGFDMSSPDAIFRAYAAARPAAPPTVATVPSTNNSMRTLYNPTMTQGLGMRERAGTISTTGDKNPYRDSLAPSSYSDDIGKAH